MITKDPPNIAIHLTRRRRDTPPPHGYAFTSDLSGQVMASVTTSENVSLAADMVKQAIKTGQSVL
jgi:hypothetical protein